MVSGGMNNHMEKQAVSLFDSRVVVVDLAL